VSDADERFKTFFEDVEPRLRHALVAAYGSDAGSDAAAEALSWAYEHWDRMQGVRSPVAYLFRVAQTRSVRIRRTMPLAREEIESHEPEVEPGLERLIRALPHQQRVSVLLVHGLEWTHGEVAELLDISSSTVATHVSRALDALRRGLGVDTDAQR
jgi:DNA-directed RNA polymerase specialized sigma24 family protein